MSDARSTLWSVRMHAAAQELAHSRHLTGAERIVGDAALPAVVGAMLARAQSRSPDLAQITIERVPENACTFIPCLPVRTVTTSGSEEAAAFAARWLADAGVAPAVIQAALFALRVGLGREGSGLRGASLWDHQTGECLESDRGRGVRASRFDYSEAGAAAVDNSLAAQGLTHFRTREALAVATKTLWAGVAAELCWSDEPDYTTGYVAAPLFGYVRLPGFKPDGARGGRIFFLDTARVDTQTCVRRLERDYALITPPAFVFPPISAPQFKMPP